MLVKAQRLYTAAGVRALDQAAIEGHGIDGHELMCRAGAAAFRLLCLRWPAARRLAIFCGGGNNGGDGLVVARLARDAGLEVDVYLAGEPARYTGAAAQAWEALVAAGGEASPAPATVTADVVVDALLGTGLERPVRRPMADLIDVINGAGVPVLALDVPSGINADTGAVQGTAVRAAATISLVGAKLGLATGAGLAHAGAQWLDDLDVPAAVADAVEPAAWRIDHEDAPAALPHRPATAHKGDCGRVLVIGGDHGMAGAARLAGEAALRSGAGLVRVATRAEHVAAMAAARPELMACALGDPATELPELLAEATVAVVGPGLGRGPWGREALAAVRAAGRPCVVDADALNLLAEAEPALPAGSVITPHPGEAARLLGVTPAAVEADRAGAAVRLHAATGAVVVLKGAGTLIHHQGLTRIGGVTNPALATGGTGDVLAGIIGGLRAQGLAAEAAAATGVGLHTMAGLRAAAGRDAGLLAGDLLAELSGLHGPHRP